MNWKRVGAWIVASPVLVPAFLIGAPIYFFCGCLVYAVSGKWIGENDNYNGAGW